MSIDGEKVEQFMGQVVGDLGATVSSALAHIGDRLGLYRAMAGAGPLTPGQLAERTAAEGRTRRRRGLRLRRVVDPAGRGFPEATVSGFDYHAGSIEAARRRAGEAGLDGSDRLNFRVADAGGYPAPEHGYDLICFFDALDDFGDPVGAAVHARESLAGDGAVMLVEIRSADRVEENLNPFGRLGYGMSTSVCTPDALSQEGGYALGGQAGPAALAEVFHAAGFTQFRPIADARIHQVLEARP